MGQPYKSTKFGTKQRTVAGSGFPSSSVSPIVRAIKTGQAGREVIPHQVVGIDNVDVTIHFNLLNQGTAATKTGTATFSNLTPVLIGPNDTLKLHCHMTIDNPTTNLAISGYSITPQTQNLNGSSVVATGPNYTGTNQFNVYQAAISVSMIAVNNAAATDVVCHCLAYLALQPG